MRKLNLIWLSALFFIILAINVKANLCTPSICPDGFTDYEINCNATLCFRNCTKSTCALDWQEVHSSTFGWAADNKAEKSSSSVSYTPTDTEKCYKFRYLGPENPSYTEIGMSVTDSGGSYECDTYAIGGLWTGGSQNSWFNGMTSNYIPGYLGDVTGTNFDYLLRTARATTGGDSTESYEDELDSTTADISVYCAPTQSECNDIDYTVCDTDCYNNAIYAHTYQGYLRNYDGQSNDEDIYSKTKCTWRNVTANQMENIHYYVYSSVTNYTSSHQYCYFPNVTGVKVIPQNPTAGDDLICNYTYHDYYPYLEKNSVYEWWKNSTNQTISSQVLGKGNLTVGDMWYCRVLPDNGLNYGNWGQSTTATILSTVKDIKMYVNNQKSAEKGGYYSGKNHYLHFENELQAVLDSCQPDEWGYCNISLTFSSDAAGTLNLSSMEIFYKTPSIHEVGFANSTELYSSGYRKIMEFEIKNIGHPLDLALPGISWSFNLGDGVIMNSTTNLSSLGINEQAWLLVDYNFSREDNFPAKATAFSADTNGSRALQVSIGDLEVSSFRDLYSSGKEKLFSFNIRNIGDGGVNNINWSFKTGEGILTATNLFNLESNETVFIYTGYGYDNYGSYVISANASTILYSDAESITAGVYRVNITSLSAIYENSTNRVFEFIIKSLDGASNSNVNWTLDTGQETVSSITQATIGPNANMFAYFEYNYSSAGAFNVNATAISGPSKKSKNITITIA